MRQTISAAVVVLSFAACKQSEPPACPPQQPCPPAAPATAPAAAPAPMVTIPGCATFTGANPVQTEMRRLECALGRAVVALGRDDLRSIGADIGVVHEARVATEQAIASGAWKPAGDLAAFVAMDKTFHDDLEALVIAAGKNDHGGAAAALGAALGKCQGCHAVYRPTPPAPAAPAPAAAPAGGEHHH